MLDEDRTVLNEDRAALNKDGVVLDEDEPEHMDGKSTEDDRGGKYLPKLGPGAGI